MSGPDAKQTSREARESLDKAESGDTKAAEHLHRDEQTKPRTTEAVEQEASEGPANRGVSR